MKILHIAPINKRANGPTSVINDLLKYQKNFAKVGLLSTYQKINSDLICQFEYEEIKIISYNKERSLNYLLFHKIEETLIQEIKKYDLVHFHGVYSPVSWKIAEILRINNIPYIISPHGNLMSNAMKKSKYKKKIVFQLFVSKFINGATLLHALTVNEKIDILKLNKNTRVKIIPNGVKNQKIQLVSSRQSIKNEIQLLFLGRVDIYGKGIDLLVKAIAIINEMEPKVSFNLNIVGPCQTKKDQKLIEKYIASHNNIKYSGPLYGEEKNEKILKSDFLILPSRSEGMPMVVLEAMSLGKPVIVTEHCNVSDIINESNSGFIISDDEKVIAEQLVEILSKDNEIFVEMGNNGCVWSRDNLAWEIISGKYKEIYEEVVDLGSNSSKNG